MPKLREDFKDFFFIIDFYGNIPVSARMNLKSFGLLITVVLRLIGSFL